MHYWSSYSITFKIFVSYTDHLLQVIPVNMVLLKNLETVTDDDFGVKRFKRELLSAMERRLKDFETLDYFAVATLCEKR